MKLLSILLLLTSIVACDPYGFGFKKNPAYVIDEAFKSISNLDLESFLEVTGKEALCIYGNESGLNYLKDNLTLNPENVKLTPKVLETRHYPSAVFVGHWSYYHERYEIEIADKNSNEVVLQTIIDCEFGTEGETNDKLINQKPKKYKKKECRLIKIIPAKFNSLPMATKCGLLKIDL
jgi:hypothetical protein